MDTVTQALETNVKWRDLSARLGRNELPEVLANAVLDDGTLTDLDEIAKAIEQSWTGAEWPEQMIDHYEWELLFSRTGFIRDGVRAARPVKNKVLYRGAIDSRQYGMSWTSDIAKAGWFANRFNGISFDTGFVYRTEVEPEDILGHFTLRGENEWVIYPREDLLITKIATAR